MVDWNRQSRQNSGPGALADRSEGSGVWPALVDVYQKHGFEAGYARGVNDALATVLEATEDFVRQRPQSAVETRRLLHAFSKFLDRRIGTGQEDQFVDGLGI
jgi:hypothetical protein